MTHVAILGLGAMGLRMAHKVLAAGHTLTVYNRTPERAQPLRQAGATMAASAREAAATADVVIAMVTDDAASRALWLDPETGAAAGLREGAVAIESSTLTPAWVRELGQAVRARGARFLDAPVLGSRPQAEAGALIFVVGGDAATLEDVRPVLDPMAGAVHHLGPETAGMTMKLAVNALFGIQAAAYGEMLGMLDKAGIARSQSAEFLAALPITSPALKRLIGLMASRSFAPNFPVALVAKDLRYAAETAAAHAVQVPTAEAVASVFKRAHEAGYGDDDIAGVAQLFE